MNDFIFTDILSISFEIPATTSTLKRFNFPFFPALEGRKVMAISSTAHNSILGEGLADTVPLAVAQDFVVSFCDSKQRVLLSRIPYLRLWPEFSLSLPSRGMLFLVNNLEIHSRNCYIENITPVNVPVKPTFQFFVK